jgi:hypothetical protein
MLASWFRLVPVSDVDPAAPEETLRHFLDSFSYGSRSDLTFKFLKKLSAADGAEAVRQILRAIADSFDTGSVAELHDLVIQWQETAYAPPVGTTGSYVYEDAPFTPLRKPLADSRVGLMTSSGHFVAGDDPEPFGVSEMTQAEAEARISEFLREPPVMSQIPLHVSPRDLRVRHGGYDVASASRDFNVAFPLDALRTLQRAGRIGEIADPVYSFPGATSQGRLRSQALPGWIDMLQTAAIDVLLLVPV